MPLTKADFKLLRQPPFKQMKKPKYKATMDGPEYVRLVREMLDEETAADYSDEEVELAVKWAFSQDAATNMSLVMTVANALNRFKGLREAGEDVAEDPKSENFKETIVPGFGEKTPFER